MLKTEEFKCLSREQKSDYLFKMFYPEIKYDKDKKKNLQIFIYNADDEELLEFYDAFIHPEKRRLYIDKQNEQIKNENDEMKTLSKNLFTEKTKVYESLDKNEADNILNNI